jgi:arylsulfatase A-like enzyme
MMIVISKLISDPMLYIFYICAKSGGYFVNMSESVRLKIDSQEGEAIMKAIMVMFDTLNRHMLPPYGCDWIHAPNFTRLAEHTVTFDKCYVGSMPCMPARRELHTGRYNFLHRRWGPIEPFDDSMPQILKNNGVYTHLVTDHAHYFEDGGETYHTRYSTWHFSRGQEGDFWKGHVKDPEIPESLMRKQDTPLWRQDLTEESLQPQAVTFAAGEEFIRTNHNEDNWFLQIETFDPHEPFFTQQHYKDLYPHEYNGPHFDWPDYKQVEETPEQIQHLRYQYAALLSMCDHYMGKVLDLMDELNLWDDTMLIVCTDHGFLLGEHDWWAKNKPPYYEEISHTPLFIWDPRCKRKGERCDALVQMIDFPATLLEFFGVERPKDMQGIPLRDAIAHSHPVREMALFGHHGGPINITDGRYVYLLGPASADNTPLYNYTLMPTDLRRMFSLDDLRQAELAGPFSFTKGCPVLKIPAVAWSPPPGFDSLLYNVEDDPQQSQPLHAPALEAHFRQHMVALMQANDAPPEQYERMGLKEGQRA